MTILNVTNTNTLTIYLNTSRKEFNMVELVEEFNEALEGSCLDEEQKKHMLIKFKKVVTGYVPPYTVTRRKAKIKHPLADERSGLMDNTY